MPFELVLSNDVNGKKTLYRKLHKVKGKEYTFKQFKKFGVHKATIYKWLKKIEQNGNCDRKSGSGTGKLTDLTAQHFHKFFLTKSLETENGNFRILCHSHRAN